MELISPICNIHDPTSRNPNASGVSLSEHILVYYVARIAELVRKAYKTRWL